MKKPGFYGSGANPNALAWLDARNSQQTTRAAKYGYVDECLQQSEIASCEIPPMKCIGRSARNVALATPSCAP